MITPILFVILVANLILVTYLVIRVRSIANLLNETNSGTAELLQRINQAETSLDKSLIHVMSVVQQGLQAQRDDALTISKQLRDDIQNTSSLHGNALRQTVNEQLSKHQQLLELFSNQVSNLTTTLDQKIHLIRESVEKKLSEIQTDTAAKLELMRTTVDEKLQSTLEKRLGDTYKLMSDRLEQVHKGLGEMQQLAQGVGDLKRVLTNVKTRGTWGEIQLGSLLEQVMTSDQYGKNIKLTPSATEHVEYAIRLPGKTDHALDCIWLPIDSKFPQEAYIRLVAAAEDGLPEATDAAIKQLETTIKLQAKTIAEKYINPPHTTDFAIMFLPTEGLYAETLRLPGLQETLQTQYRVIVAGPTTLAAILNSLQLGFRTLAIEKRSGEVWQLLTVIQAEFGKFGALLDKTQKKLHEAGQTIEDATRKTRTIERKLDKLHSQNLTLDTLEPVEQLEQQLF